ncbi:MAG: hypothetical protein LBU89_07120 [Fibromonadaceae bacterium]|jgi:hypothetical protein|nr:hypothetical protein [Fibromonadaceae bacterium]
MKKIVLITTLIVTVAFGQITVTKTVGKIDAYDSLSNYLGKDVSKYVGQEFYLKVQHEKLRKFGYRDFYIDYNENVKSALNRNNIYKCCSEGLSSKYNELAGKYFKVLEVIRHPRSSLNDKYYLKLQEKSSNDIVYFRYDAKYRHLFPFVVVGFFEKLKQRTIGQTFVFGNIQRLNPDKTQPFSFGKDSDFDINTGQRINFELGKEWECIDLTIDERNYALSLVFKDGDGQTLAVRYERIVGEIGEHMTENRFHNIFTKDEADNYKEKFGQDIWNAILQGEVKIGMTKEMCKLARSEPKKINVSEKNEQWVYSDYHLYFENDILTVIQQQ